MLDLLRITSIVKTRKKACNFTRVVIVRSNGGVFMRTDAVDHLWPQSSIKHCIKYESLF